MTNITIRVNVEHSQETIFVVLDTDRAFIQDQLEEGQKVDFEWSPRTFDAKNPIIGVIFDEIHGLYFRIQVKHSLSEYWSFYGVLLSYTPGTYDEVLQNHKQDGICCLLLREKTEQ